MRNGFFPAPKEKRTTEEQYGERIVVEGLKYSYHPHRGISTRTYEFYNVKSGLLGEELKQTGFPYPNGAHKVRNWSVKKGDKNHIFATGKMSDESLFGMDKFDPGSKDSITITEGEYDALAIHEVLSNKTAAVSIRSSVTARSDLERARAYINSFKKIYICFDSDDAGQKAAKEVSGMFDFNKVYHVKLAKYKDANEYLEKGEFDDLIRTWTNARRYSPDSIISTFSDIRSALTRKEAEAVATYPFTDIQTNLKGLHKGEMIVIKGKQGIGKTEICRAIIHESLKTNNTNMATIFLEEDQGTTIRGVCTYEAKQPVMLEDAGFTDDDVMKIYSEAVGGRDDRLYIHSHFSSEDEGEIIDNIRFLVTVAKCDIIFLDNLTMLATGREGEDERLRIDRLTKRLRNIVNELRFCLVLIAHTNDDGTTRGSRFPDIVANTVIIMTREKGTTQLLLWVDKARGQGCQEGPSGFAQYDRKTYTLRNPTDAEKAEFKSEK